MACSHFLSLSGSATRLPHAAIVMLVILLGSASYPSNTPVVSFFFPFLLLLLLLLGNIRSFVPTVVVSTLCNRKVIWWLPAVLISLFLLNPCKHVLTRSAADYARESHSLTMFL
jgi:hypothetical protein